MSAALIPDAAFLRLLEHPRPGTELRHLLAAGQGPRLPFLEEACRIPAGPLPWHSGSVLDHLCRCMDVVAGDGLAVWMALAHDAGKLTTPRVLWPHHYGHEERGETLVRQWAARLHLPADWRQAACVTARLHMKAGRYLHLRPATRYDLLHELAACPFGPSFWRVVDADTRSCLSRRVQDDWARITTLPVEGRSPEQQRQQAIQYLRMAQD